MAHGFLEALNVCRACSRLFSPEERPARCLVVPLYLKALLYLDQTLKALRPYLKAPSLRGYLDQTKNTLRGGGLRGLVQILRLVLSMQALLLLKILLKTFAKMLAFAAVNCHLLPCAGPSTMQTWLSRNQI